MTIKKILILSGILLGISAAVFIVSLISMTGNTRIIVDAQNKRTVSLQLADEIRDSSRDLTDAVRRFVITGNVYYYDEYMETLMIRSGEMPRSADSQIAPGQIVSLGELINSAEYTEFELNLIEESLRLSDELAVLEMEAMNLMLSNSEVGSHSQDTAKDLIFSQAYDDAVAGIMNPFSKFKQELDQRLNGDITVKRQSRDYAAAVLRASFCVLIVMFAAFLLLIAVVIVRPVLLCDKFARQIAAGNFEDTLSYRSGNEVGSLAESLRSMLKSLRERISLEENARYFSAVVSSVGVGIIIRDSNGLIRAWNSGAEKILGYKAEEIIGKTPDYYYPEESHRILTEMQERVKKGEYVAHMDINRKHKDGHLVCCSSSLTPVFDSDGSFTCSVAIFHDVTKQKKAEEKAQRLAAIVAIADAGIIVKDTNGVVLEWNIGAENILGYCPADIVGKTTHYYAPKETHSGIDDIEARLKKGEHIAHVDVIRKHKDGWLIDCSASYTPIFDSNGSFDGSVSIFHDVTDKKQIELKLKEALLAAEEASKAKTSFLANMSHEIRTPMNGVIGFAELALAEEDISGIVMSYLQKIKTSAGSLLHIINDILDVSKIEAGAMSLECVPFDLHEVFRECEAISHLKAEDKGITLHFYAEPIVEKRLVGDPTKLRQVLINLLSNAVKFTNRGIVKMTAALEEDNDDVVRIRFEVRDSGIGMTTEQMQNIFDPFTQADTSTTRKYGGTGLGLAITKSFVEMMGGTLELESTPGLGSKFSFTLPFDTVSASDTDMRIKDEPNILEKPLFSGEVLVCEDNLINQEVIQKHLERVGLSCVIAVNGKQCVETVKERMLDGRLFDLIFMDIHMPVMDGLEAMQKLLEMENRVPVVALTANAMITDKEKYLQQGMSDYLSKPFTAADLWACLKRHLTPINSVPLPEPGFAANNPPQTPDRQPHSINKALNEQAGIENVAGDEQFYRHLQRNFYKDNKNFIGMLDSFIEKNDAKSAHRIVHSLKSSAGMLGAERLALAAGKVETALKSGYINCPPELMETLKSAVTEVLSAVKPSSPENELKSESEDGIPCMNTAPELIEKLIPLLKSGNPACVKYACEVRIVLAHLGDVCETLASQIEDYDFDAAFETICELNHI